LNNAANVVEGYGRILFLPSGIGTFSPIAGFVAAVTLLFVPAPYQFFGFFFAIFLQYMRFSNFFSLAASLTVEATGRADLLSPTDPSRIQDICKDIARAFVEEAREMDLGFRHGEEVLRGALASYYGLLAFRRNLLSLAIDLTAIYFVVSYLPAVVAMLYLTSLLLAEIRVLRLQRFQQKALKDHLGR
jgi:hypothetical protein